MSKNLKNIGIVSGVTMGSRILGLFRDILTTAVFGASALNSAFVTAFTFPNLFRRLLGEGSLTAALIPTLHDELERNARPGAFRLVNKVASWVLILTVVIILMCAGIFWVVKLKGLGGLFGDDIDMRWSLAAGLAIILLPYLVFVCLSAAFSAALQTFGRFLEPALSPVWLNLSIIGLLSGAAFLGWASTDGGRMYWLCGAVLLGGFFQMLVPALALAREGWRPRIDLQIDGNIRQIMSLMLPTLFGSAIYLINMAVSRLIGLSLNDSAATLLNLSGRLMELPIGVFAVAITTVVFPLISAHAARGDIESLATDYRKGMRLILLINIPAAVGLAVLSAPIIRLLFQYGNFSAADTAAMAPVLMVYAGSLPFFSFVNLVLRVFYAQKDTRTPVKAALWSFVVNIVLSFALMGWLSTIGLAIAGLAAVIVQALYLQVHLVRKQSMLAFGHLYKDLVKIIASSILMGGLAAVTWLGWLNLPDGISPPQWLGLALVIVLAILFYAALLFVFRIEGRSELLALVRTRFLKKRA